MHFTAMHTAVNLDLDLDIHGAHHSYAYSGCIAQQVLPQNAAMNDKGLRSC